MRKLKILKRVLKNTGADKLLISFVIAFFIASLIIWLWEPNITSFSDAVWYCYAVFSTVGFGDEIAVTYVGRIISVILSILSLLVIALVSGVIVAFYTDIVSIRYKTSKAEIADKLERLPELSKEELTELSETIKKLRE